MPVKVVNMIPNSLSNETTRDSEPNISATFVDPSRIAASVFTPDPMGSGNAPIYVSTDGGDTWQHIGLEDSRHIAAIWVDPKNADVLFAAALGHTFAPNEERGVFKSTDGGKSWTPAKLGPDLGKYAFRPWTADVVLAPGAHALRVRATNNAGKGQPLEPAWNPTGYMRNVIETVHGVGYVLRGS